VTVKFSRRTLLHGLNNNNNNNNNNNKDHQGVDVLDIRDFGKLLTQLHNLNFSY
jgi:hypothetical protein